MTPGGCDAGAPASHAVSVPTHGPRERRHADEPRAKGWEKTGKTGIPLQSRGAAKALNREEAQICHLCARLTVSRRFDLIQSDTLREYFSSRHPKAIGIISAAYFNSQLIFDVLFV